MPDFAATLALLVALELVLGVDNIVALSIIVARLPEGTRQKARIAGLALALLARLVMVWGATWLLTLTEPVLGWVPFGGDLVRERSVKDLILLAGGAFLIWKATREIHHTVELKEEGPVEAGTGPNKTARRSFFWVILTIVAVDVVFALDSVVTAVGMTDDFLTIALAVILSFVVLLFAAGPIGEFVLANPSFKILALSFLITIGVALGLEAFHKEVPKPYIYLPMAFATGVQLLQWRLAKNVEKTAPPADAAP